MQTSEIETALCGAVMRDTKVLGDAMVAGITAEHFQHELCREIFRAAKNLWEMHGRYSVSDLLFVIGKHRLAEMSAIRAATPVALNLAPYMQALVNAKMHTEIEARLLDIGRKLTQRQALEPMTPITAALSELTMLASGSSSAMKTVDMRTALRTSIDNAEARINAGDIGPGIKSGFKRFDDVVYGLQPGFVYILGARTGVGKTSLALNMAVNAALVGNKVAFFTVEMGASDLCDKILAKMGRISLMKYFSGDLSADEQDRLMASCTKTMAIPILFTEVQRPCIDLLAIEAMRLVKVEGVKLIVIDYLQLFEMGDGKFRQPREEAKQVSGALKRLARSLDVPLLVITQLNRLTEEFSAPDLKNIAESDQIARDADVVFFIHKDNRQDYELTVAKNRRGKLEKIPLVAELQYGIFTEDSGR